MKGKIVTICLLVVYLLLPLPMMYLCSLQQTIVYSERFQNIYPAYMYAVYYLLPLLYGVLYGALLWLCIKKGREILLAIFTVVSLFWTGWGMNYYSLLPFHLPFFPWFGWMSDARNLYQLLAPVQWYGSIIAVVFLAAALIGRRKTKSDRLTEERDREPLLHRMKSKGTIVAVCLLVVYLLAPLPMIYLYAQQTAIAFSQTYNHLYQPYIYMVIYLLPLLYGVLSGVLLWLCLKKGREVLLAVFAVVSLFWTLWGMNMLSLPGLRLSFLSGFLWFDWMAEGLERYNVALHPVQQIGTIMSVVLLIAALISRRKQKNI